MLPDQDFWKVVLFNRKVVAAIRCAWGAVTRIDFPLAVAAGRQDVKDAVLSGDVA